MGQPQPVPGVEVREDQLGFAFQQILQIRDSALAVGHTLSLI